jgi:hypothetical protein
MDERSLSLSFSNSLSEDVAGIASEYAELGLDALTEDGVFKNIPIISTFMSVYRIGNSIWEKHHIAKLIAFLNEINNAIADEEERVKYREKFSGNEKFRDRELEYIIILIDRYITFEKPQMLAKLYLAYLDGKMTWKELTMYAEIIDRFLPGDWKLLDDNKLSEYTPESAAIDGVQRLISMGLVSQKWHKTPAYTYDGVDIGGYGLGGYALTDFGFKLKQIIT